MEMMGIEPMSSRMHRLVLELGGGVSEEAVVM